MQADRVARGDREVSHSADARHRDLGLESQVSARSYLPIRKTQSKFESAAATTKSNTPKQPLNSSLGQKFLVQLGALQLCAQVLEPRLVPSRDLVPLPPQLLHLHPKLPLVVQIDRQDRL